MTTVKDYPTLADFFFEESIRLDQIIWLSACSDQPPENFEDFAEDVSSKDLKRLFGIDMSDGLGAEDLLTRLHQHRKAGFLVCAATPIPTEFFDNGHSSHGFGYCTIQWFYAESLDAEFAQRLLDWKQAFLEKRKRQLSKKNKAAAK